MVIHSSRHRFATTAGPFAAISPQFESTHSKYPAWAQVIHKIYTENKLAKAQNALI